MFLENWPGLDVTVLVEDEQVAEFDDEDTYPSNKEKSKYIEAVSDANFAIKFSALRTLALAQGDCIEFRVHLDGKYVNGLVYKLNDLACGPRDRYEYTIKGRDVNARDRQYVERYKFAKLLTNDGPVGKAKAEDFKNLGEIMVKCSWCREDGARYVHYENRQPFETGIGSNVPEKCLKGRAISNRATLGAQETRTTPFQTVKLSYPYGKDAFATFKFKYRSREDLQIEGIIPRSPSPVPLEDRDPDDLSPEEARELVRCLRQTQQQQIEIKKEGLKKKRARSATLDADSDAEGVVITGATSSRKRGRQSTDSGVELIDLTED